MKSSQNVIRYLRMAMQDMEFIAPIYSQGRDLSEEEKGIREVFQEKAREIWKCLSEEEIKTVRAFIGFIALLDYWSEE